ncbi:MAG: TldD/PmbA family protein [Myxococcales bacterium]|nr:TldD/PmbA family protein [Myxococcales bacterium]MCB9644015.1 TldD/PmbA family protein [Myxococcales bacterium]
MQRAEQLAAEQASQLFGGFGEDLRQPLSKLLGWGRAAGADFIEFFLERRSELNVSVENGKLRSISPRLSIGVGVRVFRGVQDGFVSSNDVSWNGLRRCLEQALSMLGLSLPTGPRLVPDVVLEPLRDYAVFRNKEGWRAEMPKIAEVCASLLDIDAAVAREVQFRQFSGVDAIQDWQEVLVASSDGVFARDIRLHQTAAANALCVDGEHRIQVAERDGNFGHPNFLAALDQDKIAVALAERAGHLLRADFVQAGELPVVMANAFGGVIFHEACGHLLETTQVEKKSTPFWDKKGEMIAHEALTAWDEGLSEGLFGSIDMDDEGMPGQRTLLIEDGILRNFLADRLGSQKTGHPRTGSGRRQNHSYSAASRMRNTYIAPGSHTPDDVIASVDHGLYCKKLGGGSVDATGQFNFGVAEGWMIEGGKITRPVKGAILIGSASEIMRRISMCANDSGTSPGFCGSVSGRVYVTVGQPHIRVDRITVGGR